MRDNYLSYEWLDLESERQTIIATYAGSIPKFLWTLGGQAGAYILAYNMVENNTFDRRGCAVIWRTISAG